MFIASGKWLNAASEKASTVTLVAINGDEAGLDW